MGRYEIAKNAFKTPEEIFKQPKKSSLVSFGFGDLPDFGTKQEKPKTYYCPVGTEKRVGIVFKDPAHLFVGTKVHYLNGASFLCLNKSPIDRFRPADPTTAMTRCCTIGPPSTRIACVLIIYDHIESTQVSYRVMPWVFGKRVYKALNDLNNIALLQNNDFMLKKTDDRFNSWEVTLCSGACPIAHSSNFLTSISLWQDLRNWNDAFTDVLRVAEPHLNNLKSCLGRDLNDTEIKDLIGAPERRAEDFFSSIRRPNPDYTEINRSIRSSDPPRLRPHLRGRVRSGVPDDSRLQRLSDDTRLQRLLGEDL